MKQGQIDGEVARGPPTMPPNMALGPRSDFLTRLLLPMVCCPGETGSSTCSGSTSVWRSHFRQDDCVCRPHTLEPFKFPALTTLGLSVARHVLPEGQFGVLQLPPRNAPGSASRRISFPHSFGKGDPVFCKPSLPSAAIYG